MTNAEIVLSTVPMTPLVQTGQIRFVLTWPNSPADLDIHGLFLVSPRNKCEVFFGKRECLGVDLDVDNLKGGKNGVETITIHDLGKYTYTISVHKYVDISGGISSGENPISDSPFDKSEVDLPDTPLPQSMATVSVYASGYKGPVVTINIPSIVNDGENSSEYNWWNVLCLNGESGLSSLSFVNEIAKSKPTVSFCSDHYKKLAKN